MRNSSRGSLQDGRFLPLETLGRGGMGDVYRAFDRTEQRVVALKVTTERAPVGPSHPLCNEYDVWSRLRHPNIVRAYELCWSRGGPIPPGLPYLVLECVDGVQAHRWGRWTEDGGAPLLAAARQLARALAHVHGCGFLHRDLKPHNVLAREDESAMPTVRLTDFGLAARAGEPRRPGTLSGSIAYVSPEAVLGAPLDARSDLYALGILIDRLARGRPAAPDAGPRAVLHWHLDGPPVEPVPALSGRLARFVRRLTARDPDRRPPSAEAALELLDGKPARERPLRSVVDRAEIARLRLALDAARLGGCRVLRLPAAEEARERLLREVSVWTQVRDLRYYRARVSGRPHDALAALALRMLLDSGEDPRQVIARYKLRRALRLDLVGRVPVLDRPHDVGPPCGEQLAGLAADVSRFVWSRVRRATTVLAFDPGVLEDPLAAAVCRRLSRAGRSKRGFSSRGGLLLLLPERPAPRRNSQPARVAV